MGTVLAGGVAGKGSPLDGIAEAYVRLVLALGVHEPSYVDAYYGPAEWKSAVEREKLSLDAIADRGRALLGDLRGTTATGELVRLRHQYLTKQLSSLVARAAMVGGRVMKFDEESAALYDGVEPSQPESYYRSALSALERELPGAGSLADRYNAFVSRLAIPRAKLEKVFAAAIDESRARTRKRMRLPKGERFDVEYVGNQPWSAYNWYKGGARSVIQVNADFPIDVDRVINLASHEGYPGHHVYNALLEEKLLKQRGWVEFSIYPLFSPQSLIAEGTAEYGFALAFPFEERKAFAREVLCPLAGLDGSAVDRFFAVRALAGKLAVAANEAARLWLDGRIDAAECLRWLTSYALMPADRAKQRMRFFEINRSYVINYTLGQEMVRAYVEKRAGTDRGRQWREFAALLASPRLPSGLV
jgi:hypothetical protein